MQKPLPGWPIAWKTCQKPVSEPSRGSALNVSVYLGREAGYNERLLPNFVLTIDLMDRTTTMDKIVKDKDQVIGEKRIR
jgi:hypothetical protein